MRSILLVVATIILMAAFLMWFYFNGYRKSKQSTFAADIILIMISATVIIMSVFMRSWTLEEQPVVPVQPEQQDIETDIETGDTQQGQESVSANERAETEYNNQESVYGNDAERTKDQGSVSGDDQDRNNNQ